MNTSNLEARVNEVAKEIIFQATCEASTVNREVSKRDLEIELECAVEFLTFENHTALFLFKEFVMRVVKKEKPELFPRVGMDQEGNWTYDSSKWA